MADNYLRITDIANKKVPVSRPTIYRMVKSGTFPKPFKLGSASVWIEKEIDDYLDGLKKQRVA